MPPTGTAYAMASGWEDLTLDAYEQHVAQLQADLRKSESMRMLIEREMSYLREQYALLEGQLNALLEKAAAGPPTPPRCG